ncbi:hypothetical protein CRENPOLYSF2_3790010 [Crenothrix polyspora]|uniref:Uncharacterized protein n=1 Tax=Crenothrix polyspora TaxID=360316 RepID=A0A1R4HE50_9GAMM|nr:hypothetical protein CRENPOLYSF2_3790010 [Crenothrix polyspora]
MIALIFFKRVTITQNKAGVYVLKYSLWLYLVFLSERLSRSALFGMTCIAREILRD